MTDRRPEIQEERDAEIAYQALLKEQSRINAAVEEAATRAARLSVPVAREAAFQREQEAAASARAVLDRVRSEKEKPWWVRLWERFK